MYRLNYKTNIVKLNKCKNLNNFKKDKNDSRNINNLKYNMNLSEEFLKSLMKRLWLILLTFKNH